MDFLLVLGIAAAVLVIVGIASLHSARRARQRRDALQSAAGEMGVEFSAADTGQLGDRFAPFQLFQQGRRRKFYNIVTADTGGMLVTVFDYEFTTGSGKSQHTYRTTVIGVDSQNLRLPQIGMRPENLFDALIGMFGTRDIDFAENKEFSKSFLLRSANDQVTRKLFDAPVLDFFTARRGVSFEAEQSRFIVYRKGKLTSPQELKAKMDEGLQLHNMLVSRVESAWAAAAPAP